MLLPLPILLFTYGPEFIALWIGPEYAIQGRWALYFLTASVLVDSFQPLIWRFFIGVGHLNILVLVSAIVSMLSIVGSILLVGHIGIAGVAVSLFAGSVVSQIMYLLHASRYLEMSWFKFIAQVNLRPLAVAVVVFFVARAMASTLGSSTYTAMIAGSVISVLTHVSLCMCLALSAKERRVVLGKVSSLLPGR
jgi:O-antigen/teichoic acid export membrane protein